MSDAAIIALITGLPAILVALATLILVIKGNNQNEQLKAKLAVVGEIIDGKFSEMLKAITSASEIKGKVETIERITTTQQNQAPTTVVVPKGGIIDRRSD